jgi:hypothetical protein
VVILPEQPTRLAAVAITLGGEWPNSCRPNASSISVVGNDIYFDVIQDYPAAWNCFSVIVGWSRTESVGPLALGTYTVYARLVETPPWPTTPYEQVGAFEVMAVTYYVEAGDGNDLNNGLTPETAFATIQKGIDTAQNGDTVLVYPGVYTEEVDFLGKAITVQSIDEPAVLRAPGSFAVWFYHEEDANSVLKNFIIEDSFAGLVFIGSSPTVRNVTVVATTGGAWAMEGANPDISNSIFWDNWVDLSDCEARYSRYGESDGSDGSTDADPCFADPCSGDYHLLSWCGRYSAEQDIWVVDKVTSPCIDAGDPNHDPGNEPMPDGGRINMGAYGGTTQASMSGCAISGCWLLYQFDETDGNTAYDSSGYEHHGSVDGPNEGPNWDPNDGRFDGCLVFNNDTAVVVPRDLLRGIDCRITVAVWLKDAYRAGSNNWVFDTGAGDFRAQAAVVEDSSQEVLWRAGNDTNDVLRWDLDGIDPSTLEEWHHWAFVKDEIEGYMEIYFDGEPVASADVVDDTLSNVRNTPFNVGAGTYNNNDFVGRMDDFRVFSSLPDMPCLFRGGCWPIENECAWRPVPSDGSVDVAPDVELQWKPGDSVVEHRVFFGASWQDVNSMTDPCAVKSVGDESYDPGPLEPNATYYWRIDEVNEPNVWKCQVWSFTVANFLVVDDFESYDETTNSVYYTWEDGLINLSGSFVDLAIDPCEPVHGGNQSMLFIYDNSIKWDWDHYWSEAKLPFDSPQDWTEAGVKALTLYFYGDPGNDVNDTEQLYVGLTGSLAEVRYTDDAGRDMNDLKLQEWTEWNIPISDFNSPQVVDPCAVTALLIGFGDRDNTSAQGGMGVVFFDDIRLYPPRCFLPGPYADLSGDCVVDYKDLKIMADEWLCSGGCAADLYLDDKVDFKDFAVLVDSWLASSLWP